MPRFRTIEIDFDVHRCLENERRSFDESPNDVLRRLLNLGEPVCEIRPILPGDLRNRRSWTDGEVELPHGTAVRMTYNRRTYEGAIVDGEWVIGDKKFTSPSGAASGVGRTKKGETTRLNGVILWQVRRPGDSSWVAYRDLLPNTSRQVTSASLEELGL